MRLLRKTGEEDGLLGEGILMKQLRILIPGQVEEILETLKAQGFEAYAVGGCVRDVLLGRTPGDWDITTSARPQQVKKLFRRTIDTGIEHGTVTIMMGKTGYEVTTYRVDGEYEDGRHPRQVQFTSSLLEDLRRRDFTINAMAYSHETGIVDAFGGMEDLDKRLIRCVGSAEERFSEDALRILRAIRFCAQLDFSIEEETQKAITAIAPNLEKVSRERIQMELTKLLLSDHPERIRQVYEAGTGAYVSPAFGALPWETVEIAASLPAVKYVRWAAFLRCACRGGGQELHGAAASTAVRILRDLKLDNDTIAKVKTLVSWDRAPLPAKAAPVRRAMSSMEPEVWDALMELNGYGEEIRTLSRKIREDGDCLSLKELSVTGQDLIAAGVKPGKEIGEILRKMLDHVLEYPQENHKDILIRRFLA